MGQILVDGIDDAVIAALRDRASRHRAVRLEAEACVILEGRGQGRRPNAQPDPDEMTEAERAV